MVVNLQGKIIKKQFSEEKEADDFANYIENYIDRRSKKKNQKESKLTENFMTLKEQYEKDMLKENALSIDDIEKRVNNCYKKSIN